MEKNQDSMNIAHLNELIDQKKNAEVKAILLKDATCNLINKQESTLMHTAVDCNNIDVITFLFTFGFDINTQDSLGQTPLLLAAKKDSHQAIQLLLTLDADVLAADVEDRNTLQILLHQDKLVPVHLIGILFDRLKRYELQPNQIANELAKAQCPLEVALKFYNPEVTREFFILTNEMDQSKVHGLLHRAISTLDVENTRVLLQYASTILAANDPVEIINVIDPARPFFEQFIDWDGITKDFLCLLCDIFENENEDIVKVYLDTGVDKYCREKFGWELLVYLFYNKNINVIKLLENRQFDVNGREWLSGYTALHVATLLDNEQQIIFLLERGASPNVRSRNGSTPLFYLNYKNLNILKLFIEAGADLQLVINNRNVFASFIFNDLSVAHLMIAQDRGLLLEETRAFIYNNNDFHFDLIKLCESHTEDLAWMKNRTISKSVNLFMLLMDEVEKTFSRLKSEEDLASISEAIHERKLQTTYLSMLMKNFQKLCEINELRLKAATFLCSKMHMDDYKHLVIEVIVGFLTYKDLLVFNEI